MARMLLVRLLVVHAVTIAIARAQRGTAFVLGRSARPLKDPTQHPNWKLFDHSRCGLSQADRIIGGQDANLGAYPWIVSIGYVGPGVKNVLFHCGGVLVNKHYVITASHCVSNLPRGLLVGVLRLGEHNTNTDPDCEDDVCADPIADYYPTEVISHAGYGKPQYKNDIAIIRTDRPVEFTDFVGPICMIYGPLLQKTYEGAVTEVAGWGIYDIEAPMASVILQTIKLNVVSNAQCAKVFRAHADIGPTQMCVGGIKMRDSCGGDSGGPLMRVEALDGPPRYFLLGVVSFGTKRCGSANRPGVYTRISSYLDWILDNMHI